MWLPTAGERGLKFSTCSILIINVSKNEFKISLIDRKSSSNLICNNLDAVRTVSGSGSDTVAASGLGYSKRNLEDNNETTNPTDKTC